MSSVDASGGTGGGGAPGPAGSNMGGGGGAGSGGGPGGSIASTNGGVLNTAALSSMSSSQAPTGVAAKISHVKTAIDGNLVVNTSSGAGGGTTLHIGAGGTVSGVSTIMTSTNSSTGAIKMTTAGGAIATSIGGGTPIALNVAQPSTAIRTIGAGGQSTQVRVVMPTNIIPIKQFESTAGVGRTQITAIPAGVAAASSRTVSNTSITVTRPMTQTTYFPRAGVTATQMTAVGTGQRLVTPLRTGPNAGVMNTTGATVTGLTAAGGFVRSGSAATVSRNSGSPATSVISTANNTTWMQTNTGGQVQLIRAIPQQPQKRIIATQGMPSTAGAYSTVSSSAGLGAVSGTVVATTPPTVLQTVGGQTQNQQSTIQTLSSSSVSHSQSQSQQQQQQQTYVATLAAVLPPRQHQATLVYSSQALTQQQQQQQQQQLQQQFNSTVASGQRLAVATQLTATAASATGGGTTSRQIRPIPLPKSFSTAKLNTTSISIRAPNITSTLQPVSGGTVSGGVVGAQVQGGGTVLATGTASNTNSSRNTTISSVTGGVGSNVIPAANLSATRIIQLQQQPGGTAQPIIGPTGRISGNVMFQPIIVNTSGTSKIVSGLRQPVTMTTKPSLTITPFGLGKLPAAAGANTTQVGVNLTHQANVNTSIQNAIAAANNLSANASGGGNNSAANLSSSTPTSSGGVGVTNLSTAQLVNVSQAAAAAGQMLTTQNILSSAAAAGGGVGGTTVLPLAITTRGGTGGNILTGTITPLKNANTITVGKMMATAANVSNLDNSSNNGGAGSGAGAGGNSNIITSNAGQPTNVYIHQAATAQRIHGQNINVGGGASLHAAPTSASGNTTVLTSTSSGGSGGGNASSGLTASAGAFLPTGGTIYYESVPASSVQVSTGVLSLTTTTVTNSTLPTAQNQLANTLQPSNIAITSLPFASSSAAAAASHAGNSTATFTVVPSTVGRSIGQLQLPVSSATGGGGGGGTQIQALPLRFSAHLTNAQQQQQHGGPGGGASANASSSNTLIADAISVSQATQQLLQQSGVTAGGQPLLIPASVAAAVSAAHQAANNATAHASQQQQQHHQQQQQSQHVVIPLQTSIKVTGGGNASGSAVVSNFLRKRDADGSPIRAAKNLGPTLLSMSGNSVVGAGAGTIIANASSSTVASSVANTFSITTVASSVAAAAAAAALASPYTAPSTSTTTPALTAEALAKKDRAQAQAQQVSSGGNVIGAAGGQRMARGESPASSDGSTTVSANSSPGVEQQIQDGNIMIINRMPHGTNESTHFNPINEMYANHHGNVSSAHHNMLMSGGTPISSRNSSLDHHQQLHAPVAAISSARVNGGPIECSTRKKCRRSTNDSQLSNHSQGSLSLPPPSASGGVAPTTTAASHMNNSNNSNYDLPSTAANGGMLLAAAQATMPSGSAGMPLAHPYDGGSGGSNSNAVTANAAAHTNNTTHKNNNLPPMAGNKENAKPSEFTLRRPRNITLLNAYKQNWKTANNHFQRYSDVKPREERRPTVIDLANQPNVLCKINGWKIHHLRSQMEDLCENESNGYDQLSNMLKQMETHEKNPEIERINELLKGNIQRSKIIVDGINDAQNQMMKIFEHKTHIADIISRCASKRNFKKREKF